MLFLQETGSPDAPTIVFLHGGGVSGRMWQPQIERLPDYHCLVPDLPEQGRSADVKPFTLDGATKQVEEIIRQHTKGGRAHIVGLSLGGAVALTLLRTAPQCVDHIIVSGTSARMGQALGQVSLASLWMYRFFKPEKLVEASLRQFGIPEQYKDLLHDDLLQGSSPDFTRHTIEALMAQELPTKSSAPLLVAVGTKETLVAKRAAIHIAQAVPNARGVRVPGAGHVWNLQKPDLFTDMVRCWITDAPLPAGLEPLAGSCKRLKQI